ncbi:MAG: phenylalanine--tRNA ligase subunit beta, partial [Deltaproteobacteria bacterium]|nr:phenylalanine--tRNA ligase subunit beta [Deltaproteobacteria bacterium]
DEDILGGDILEAVHAFEPIQKILEDVSIFDVYQGKGIDKGKKSIAISISLRDKDRTLKENEVQPIVDELTEKLCKELDATIRG